MRPRQRPSAVPGPTILVSSFIPVGFIFKFQSLPVEWAVLMCFYCIYFSGQQSQDVAAAVRGEAASGGGD
jgi:hypothetical protein